MSKFHRGIPIKSLIQHFRSIPYRAGYCLRDGHFSVYFWYWNPTRQERIEQNRWRK